MESPKRVEADIAHASRSETIVSLPSIGVSEICGNGIAQRITERDGRSFHVHAAVENIGIDQIRIECVLLDVLPEGGELPVVLGFNFSDSHSDLVGERLVIVIRMARRGGTIVRIEVGGEVAENAHGKFSHLPTELDRQLEYEQAVDGTFDST